MDNRAEKYKLIVLILKSFRNKIDEAGAWVVVRQDLQDEQNSVANFFIFPSHCL